MEQSNSPLSLSSRCTPAGAATTGTRVVLTSSDPSPCHITSTNHSSKFNVGLSKAESVTMASHLPKSDPDCSQAQNIAHRQPQDKPKARGHKVPILNRIFSVSCGSQAEARASLICSRLSLQKTMGPLGTWKSGEAVCPPSRETNGDTATAVTFPVTIKWKQLSNFFFSLL